MSDPSETPWSNDPNAPQISPWVYVQEKDSFTGLFIGLICYGIVAILFFQCVGVLLSPANPIKRKIKWALVVHTVALFLFLTIPVGIELNYLFITYIENREFPGGDEHPPGPLGYDDKVHNKAAFSVLNFMFPLNQWLADGLLLHRCFVIYSMNHSVMAFPYLVYLASIAVGAAHIYQDSGSTDASVNLNTAYLSICLSLNVLLTLMIVIRLVVHIRNVRRVIGDSEGSDGLHTAATTVVTMLIESYALYAIAILLYIVPWVVHSAAVDLFSKVLGTIQVIAPYLIILRVAKRGAVTSESISGVTESIRFRSQGTSDGDGSLPDRESMNSTDMDGEASSGPGTRDENGIEEVPL